jgi:hypothetical protein
LSLLDRRQWLRLGGLFGLGLTLPPLAAASGGRSSGFGRAKSVLLIFTAGGQSQLETWDPKPNAPAEIRGAFGTIPTSVPGVAVCEHLPRLARLAQRYCIVRNVAHDDLDHGSACYLALTGHPHPRKSSNPPPRPTDQPCLGAILHRARPATDFPYTAAHVNGPLLAPVEVAPGQYAGLLGRACEPLVLGDPTEPVAVRGLEPLPELPPERLEDRRALLSALDERRRALERAGPVLDRDVVLRRAYDLLAAPQCRQAFDLSREPLPLRERYGLHRSGLACLLGRRLIEAGVPLVTVFWNHGIRGQDMHPEDPDAYGWDTHNDIFDSLKNPLLPRFDVSFSALLEDMEQRGLLESTLVICMGEFGRAPLVAVEKTFAGTYPGRKHWAGCYSIVLAGAGVKGGAVVGASDRHGAYPSGDAVGPWDVAATVFHALGLDPATHYADPAGRIFPLATGKAITAVYG